MLTPVQILGEKRPATKSPNQLLALSNSLATLSPHPHHSFLLNHLPRRRLALSQRQTAGNPVLKTHSRLSLKPALPPRVSRIHQPILPQTIHSPPPHRLRKQLPHCRRPRQLSCWLRSSRPRCRRPLRTPTFSARSQPYRPSRLWFRMSLLNGRVCRLASGISRRWKR